MQSGIDNSSFEYESLDGEGAIRLLTIQPGAEDDHIVCYLHHNVSLDVLKNGGPKFDALSYQWGPQNPSFPIALDGQEFRVGRSLYDALKVMRRTDEPRLVWTDAICINQGGYDAAIAEREIQVKMMQDIYGTASQTVIWLGPEEDSSNLAMDFIEYQAIMEPTRSKLSMEYRWRGWTTNDDYFFIVREPKYVPVWEALFKLCKRAYWSRMWIVQEIALSADPIVHCGTREVKWADFELVLGLIFAMIEDRVPGSTFFWHLTPLLENSFPLLLEQQRGRKSKQKDAKWLLGTLQRHRNFAATKPHDKLFGFLGLVDQNTRNSIVVDYQSPVEKIYTEIFKVLVPRQRWSESDSIVTGTRPEIGLKFTITAGGTSFSGNTTAPESRRHGPLNILCSAGYSPSRANNGLPSWVPDWRDGSHPLTIDNITNCRMLACDGIEPNYRIHGNSVLETGGYEFGALRWLSPSPSEIARLSDGSIKDDDEALVCCVADAMVEAISAGIAGHKFDPNRFWRTLVFDSFPTQSFFRAPEVWGRMDSAVLCDFIAGKELSDAAKELLPSEYIIMLRKTLRGRKFAVTVDGSYVIVPEEASFGDKVCVVWGCDVPMVLGRRHGQLVLIGECYCDVLSDGTWLDRLTAEECEGPRGTFSIH